MGIYMFTALMVTPSATTLAATIRYPVRLRSYSFWPLTA